MTDNEIIAKLEAIIDRCKNNDNAINEVKKDVKILDDKVRTNEMAIISMQEGIKYLVDKAKDDVAIKAARIAAYASMGVGVLSFAGVVLLLIFGK